jgi:hypothetical protein
VVGDDATGGRGPPNDPNTTFAIVNGGAHLGPLVVHEQERQTSPGREFLEEGVD